MKTERRWLKVLVQIARWIVFLPASVVLERLAGAVLFMLTRDLFVSWFGTDFAQDMGYVDASFIHPIVYGWIGCLQSIVFVLAGAIIVPKGKKTVAVIQGVLRIGFFVWILTQAIQHSGLTSTVFILSFWMIAGSVLGIVTVFRMKDSSNKKLNRTP